MIHYLYKFCWNDFSWLRDDNDLGVSELELYMDRVEKDDDANNNADEIDGAITDTQPNNQIIIGQHCIMCIQMSYK